MADWEDNAACQPERLSLTAREAADLFFPPGEEGVAGASADLHAALAHAKAICRTCPVRSQCLDAALDRGETYGVWGGLSGRALTRARKQRGLRLSTSRVPAHDLEPCGTEAAYRRHRRRGEKACDACLAANRVAVANRNAARGGAA